MVGYDRSNICWRMRGVERVRMQAAFIFFFQGLYLHAKLYTSWFKLTSMGVVGDLIGIRIQICAEK